MVMSLMSNPKGSVATIIVSQAGDGDTTDIQTGINMLPTGGGVVYIKEGTYTITTTITFPNDNISLIGAGRSTIVYTTTNISSINIISRLGILIDSIYFLTTVGPQGVILDDTTDSFINRCWFNGFDEAIFITNASNYNSIFSNHFTNNEGQAILMDGGNSNIITNNIIWNNTGTGIYTETNNNIINDNLAYNNDEDGISSAGDFNLIQGNQVYDNGAGGAFGTGIRLMGSADRNIVLGNYVRGNFTAQITDGGTNNQIGHNITT